MAVPHDIFGDVKSRFAQALLSRAPVIAKCPKCSDDNIFRHEDINGGGPVDHCMACGHSFAHKPGTITARQHADRTEGN